MWSDVSIFVFLEHSAQYLRQQLRRQYKKIVNILSKMKFCSNYTINNRKIHINVTNFLLVALPEIMDDVYGHNCLFQLEREKFDCHRLDSYSYTSYRQIQFSQ